MSQSWHDAYRKNIYDNVIGTLLNIKGKLKENLKTRLNLVDIGCRSEIHPQTNEGSKSKLPPVLFTMTEKERGSLWSCEECKNPSWLCI